MYQFLKPSTNYSLVVLLVTAYAYFKTILFLVLGGGKEKKNE